MNKADASPPRQSRIGPGFLTGLIVAGLLCLAPAARSEQPVTLTMRDASLAEVMEMLSRTNRVNILLADGVGGKVSFNLFEVSVDQAVRSIASIAGYVVEKQDKTYFIMPTEKAGKSPGRNFTKVRTFPIEYTEVTDLESKLEDYLSEFGSITAVPDRKLLIVKDQPDYLERISQVLAKLDRRPKQILIEAKILEVKLNDEQSYGIDWAGTFTSGDGEGDFGLQGLLSPGNSGNTGFFFNYLEPDIDAKLRLLQSDGRVRNLASPKVVTIADQEAEVVIGDRRGYRVTTTINQVTTESIEFLESGVILRVTPTVGDNDEILLNIHPEVSIGSVDENGIPSQTTTEVTTRLLVPSGKSIFIGGLMRNTTNETVSGMPFLSRVPGIRWLFSNTSRTTFNTETVVIITPRVVDDNFLAESAETLREFEETKEEMGDRASSVEGNVEDRFSKPDPADATAPAEAAMPIAEAGGAVTSTVP